VFPLPSASRPALGPTQPRLQWVPGALSPGVKRGRGVMLTTHPLLVPRLTKSRSYTSCHRNAPLGSVTGPLYLYIYPYFGLSKLDKLSNTVTGLNGQGGKETGSLPTEKSTKQLQSRDRFEQPFTTKCSYKFHSVEFCCKRLTYLSLSYLSRVLYHKLPVYSLSDYFFSLPISFVSHQPNKGQNRPDMWPAWKMRNTYKILVDNLEGNTSHRRSWRKERTLIIVIKYDPVWTRFICLKILTQGRL
jgi:hypothetical protein